MLHTRLGKLLDIDVPIVAAPMGPNITGIELVAAFSNAGGNRIISFGAKPPSVLREQIHQLRELIHSPERHFPPAPTVITSGSSPRKEPSHDPQR